MASAAEINYFKVDVLKHGPSAARGTILRRDKIIEYVRGSTY